MAERILTSMAENGMAFWAVIWGMLMTAVAGFIINYASKLAKKIHEYEKDVGNLKDLAKLNTRYILDNMYQDCKKRGFVNKEEEKEFSDIYDIYDKRFDWNGSGKATNDKFTDLSKKTTELDLKELVILDDREKTEIVSEVLKIVEKQCKEMKEYIDKNIDK